MLSLFQLIGTIDNPLPSYGSYLSATRLLSNIIRLLIVGAGLYALVNFVIAGIGFINSAGNPEGIQKSWAKIYQSIIGLAVVMLSFAFAAILGMLLYGNPSAILQPEITGPGG
jgi:hypothetical protein